jgi:hypothetical protein
MFSSRFLTAITFVTIALMCLTQVTEAKKNPLGAIGKLHGSFGGKLGGGKLPLELANAKGFKKIAKPVRKVVKGIIH